MKTDLEDRAMDLFEEVLGMEPGPRAARLREECAAPELRAAVEDLFAHHHQAETVQFLEPSPAWFDGIPESLPDFGPFTNIRYLGHGGMGVVYRAFDKGLGKEVALKTVLPRHVVNPDVLRIFYTEARSMARLEHPGIIHVFHVDQHEGRPYFTMWLVDGVSLDKRLGEFQQNPRAAATLLVRVTRAIHHAHQRNIIHRDLKPGNILLDEDGKVLVTDFGLAKLFGADECLLGLDAAHDTASRFFCGILGTAQYMSPEQATVGGNVTTRSDVYGLGAVLYALLTGQPPFRAKTIEATLALVRDPKEMPVPPRALNRRVDPDLQAVCLKCLNKDPDQRYRSAEGLARDLERWLEGKETTALPWSRPYRLWRWCKRHPARAAWSVAALVGLAVVPTIISYLLLQERERQVLAGSAHMAQSVANTFEARLQHFASAVAQQSRDPELRQHLSPADRAQLQKWIERVSAFYADPDKGFIDAGERTPFASWFVLDDDGNMLAHSVKAQAAEGEVSWRDYFRGVGKLKDGESTYVSRIYKGRMADALYKFAIAAPVRDGAKRVGVVVATVTTASAEDILLPKDAPQKAVLVGHWDDKTPARPNPKIPTGLHAPGERLILLHPAFARGDPAVVIHNEQLFGGAAPQGGRLDENYADPVATRDARFAGRWLAAAAPVRRTEFTVIVQQNRAESVQPFAIFLIPMMLWIALVFGLFGCAFAMACSAGRRVRLADSLGAGAPPTPEGPSASTGATSATESGTGVRPPGA